MDKASFRHGKTEVLFASDFKQLSEMIGSFGNEVLWLFDTNTARMVRPLPEPNFILEPGDISKNLRSVENIIRTASDEGFGKDSVVLAFGGGCVCDTASVAASMYKGGCRLVFVPTTLVAMTESSLSSSGAINFKSQHNLISTQYSAESVVICPDILKSLSDYEFSNGMSYLIKHAYTTETEGLRKILLSRKNKIQEKEQNCISDLVYEALIAKKSILQSRSVEMVSRFGLCFSNTLENMKTINCSHGQAVCWGVLKAVELSCELGFCNEKFKDSISGLYSSYGFKTDFRINRSLWSEFKRLFSKELSASEPEIVLIRDYGELTVSSVDEDILKKTVIEGADKHVLL